MARPKNCPSCFTRKSRGKCTDDMAEKFTAVPSSTDKLAYSWEIHVIATSDAARKYRHRYPRLYFLCLSIVCTYTLLLLLRFLSLILMTRIFRQIVLKKKKKFSLFFSFLFLSLPFYRYNLIVRFYSYVQIIWVQHKHYLFYSTWWWCAQLKWDATMPATIYLSLRIFLSNCSPCRRTGDICVRYARSRQFGLIFRSRTRASAREFRDQLGKSKGWWWWWWCVVCAPVQKSTARTYTCPSVHQSFSKVQED